MLPMSDREVPAGSLETGPETVATQALLAFLLDVDGLLADHLDSGLLTHEARLAFQLFTRGPSIVKEAALSSRLSSRAFHELLRRMEDEGHVSVSPSLHDRRTRAISLTPELRDALLDRLVPPATFGPLRPSAPFTPRLVRNRGNPAETA